MRYIDMYTYNKAMDYVIIALTASMRGNDRLAKRAFGKALSNRRALAEAVEDMNEMQEDKVEEDIDMGGDDDIDDDDIDDDDDDVESYFMQKASNRARRRIFSMEDDEDVDDDDDVDIGDDDIDDDDLGDGGVAESRFMRNKRYAIRANARRRGNRRRSSLVSVESRLIRGGSNRRRSSGRSSRLGRVSRNLASI